MKNEGRKDMAHGNAIKLVQQASGLKGAKGKEAAEKAASKAQVVEDKLDVNTETTRSVDHKADIIASQTNGTNR